jgi:hypothetical protein
MENRNGLIAAAMVTDADVHVERDAALLLRYQKQKSRSRRIIVGTEKEAHNSADSIRTVHEISVTPHIGCCGKEED